MDAKPLGVGIVGVGMVAATHAKAVLEIPDQIRVEGVFARSPERRRAFAERYGFPEAASLEALIGNPEIGAVIVLTPPNARREIVQACAVAGKSVLLEKPVERGTRSAREIVGIADAAGITLGVVFQNRFRPGAQALKRLANEQSLGRIATVQVVMPWWRPQAYYDEPGRGTLARDGGGVLINQAIHMLDLALWIAGPVEEVQAMAGTSLLHRMEAEDFVAGGLRFANGALGAVLANTASFPGESGHIAVDFEHGSARLEGSVLTVQRHGGQIERLGEESATGGGADPMAFSHEWHRMALADFAEAVLSRRPPAVTAGEAIEVHRLIDALMMSASTRRAVGLAEIE